MATTHLLGDGSDFHHYMRPSKVGGNTHASPCHHVIDSAEETSDDDRMEAGRVHLLDDTKRFFRPSSPACCSCLPLKHWGRNLCRQSPSEHLLLPHLVTFIPYDGANDFSLAKLQNALCKKTFEELGSAVDEYHQFLETSGNETIALRMHDLNRYPLGRHITFTKPMTAAKLQAVTDKLADLNITEEKNQSWQTATHIVLQWRKLETDFNQLKDKWGQHNRTIPALGLREFTNINQATLTQARQHLSKMQESDNGALFANSNQAISELENLLQSPHATVTVTDVDFQKLVELSDVPGDYQRYIKNALACCYEDIVDPLHDTLDLVSNPDHINKIAAVEKAIRHWNAKCTIPTQIMGWLLVLLVPLSEGMINYVLSKAAGQSTFTQFTGLLSALVLNTMLFGQSAPATTQRFAAQQWVMVQDVSGQLKIKIKQQVLVHDNQPIPPAKVALTVLPLLGVVAAFLSLTLFAQEESNAYMGVLDDLGLDKTCLAKFEPEAKIAFAVATGLALAILFSNGILRTVAGMPFELSQFVWTSGQNTSWGNQCALLVPRIMAMPFTLGIDVLKAVWLGAVAKCRRLNDQIKPSHTKIADFQTCKQIADHRQLAMVIVAGGARVTTALPTMFLHLSCTFAYTQLYGPTLRLALKHQWGVDDDTAQYLEGVLLALNGIAMLSFNVSSQTWVEDETNRIVSQVLDAMKSPCTNGLLTCGADASCSISTLRLAGLLLTVPADIAYNVCSLLFHVLSKPTGWVYYGLYGTAAYLSVCNGLGQAAGVTTAVVPSKQTAQLQVTAEKVSVAATSFAMNFGPAIDILNSTWSCFTLFLERACCSRRHQRRAHDLAE